MAASENIAQDTRQASIIGAAVPRIDGPMKTTGTAKYASDWNLPELLYANPVGSTISSGRIKSIDTAKASAMRGVRKVYTSQNLPKLYRSNPGDRAGGHQDERRAPLEDDNIYYVGQYVAVVVAETMNQARAAAAVVAVEYEATKANVSRDLADGFHPGMRENSKRGDAEAAFTTAAIKVDETYITPVEVHNPIEMHATVAHWDGKRFLLYESTQGVVNTQTVMAQVLGVPKEQVQVVTKFLGSGFGGKLWPWTHTALAAVASRDLRRPVKLVVDRDMMFKNVGHRPQTTQKIKLGATPDGKLTSVQHDYTSDTSINDSVGENCGEATPLLYSTANLRVRSSMVKRNVGCPTAMRGPGAVPGLFALESAMDELAIKLKLDPVELRLRNETKIDESENKPFSSRHLVECIQQGAERFGWSKRTPGVGSMRRGDVILGWGMAACTWGAMRQACKVTFLLRDDGSAVVQSGVQDVGTGTYTIFAQAVHEKTGVPMSAITVTIGESSLPPGPVSGGSWLTSTVLPAIDNAVEGVSKTLVGLAAQSKLPAVAGKKAADLAYTRGMVHAKDAAPESGVTAVALMKEAKLRQVAADGSSESLMADANARKYSSHSFGAQFVEVEWDPGIARLRVSRVVSAIDVGRIINRKTAANQIEGAVVMGVGMALFEEGIYDDRTGQVVNANLADYIMPVNADSPEIDVIFTDFPDLVANAYGARGCGEIGLAGVAPAITAAVYHATGVRVRELPVRIEDLLKASVPPLKTA